MDELVTKTDHHAPARLPPRPRDVAALRDLIVKKLTYQVGREPNDASDRDWFVATAHAIRDFVVERWLESNERAVESGGKRVYYLSLEFLSSPAVRRRRQSRADGTNTRGTGIARHRHRETARTEPDAALG